VPKVLLGRLFYELVKKRREDGGRKEDRTPDPQNANLVLSQLSYAPVNLLYCLAWWVWAELNSRPRAYQARALTT
jgi:hypothetical protein